ncbi:uncharacterized protein BYT42DRAFT_590526, partial [Radiomyces spectabilis]|uniref:uncharacterized protein n=1 Tax=Radiomyces spectabilis TaxID=64574 RepID=UPI00221E6A8B
VEYYQKAFGFLSGFLFAWQVIHPSKSFYFVRVANPVFVVKGIVGGVSLFFIRKR